MSFVGGRTGTSAAVRLLRTDLFTATRGARESVPQVAVIVSDGRFDSYQGTFNEVFIPSLALSFHAPVSVIRSSVCLSVCLDYYFYTE